MTSRDRSAIICLFRDRIHQGDRLKLSKAELETLIAGFIAQLQSTADEQAIQALCEAEIQLLEEGYPQASVAKYLTRYRKAIVAAIEAGDIVLNENNSHRFIHQQRVTGHREERLEHWALTYLKYTPEIYESIDKRSQLVNRDKQLNLRLVPVERYLALLQALLEKKGLFEARWLATAIAGITGRRFAEVVAKGTFALTPHPYLLRFKGQLKSRASRNEGYDVVTLFPAQEVLTAIDRLRQLKEVSDIMCLQGAALSIALNGFNQKLNATCGKVLMQMVPPLEGKQTVSVHNLRSLYGAIAVYLFCPERQHEYAFVQHFLGHVMDSPATGHYFRYALSDDQGNLLHQKGVLFNQVPELPLGRPESTLEWTAAHDEPMAVESLSVLPLAVAPLSKSQPKSNQRSSRAVPQQMATPETVITTSDLQRLHQEWRAELERRLEQLRIEFAAQMQEIRQDNNLGWFVRRIENLERENLALRLERDKVLSATPKQNERVVEQLKAENAALAQELKLAQDTLEGFRRLLNGSGPGVPQTAESMGQMSESMSQASDAVKLQAPAPPGKPVTEQKLIAVNGAVSRVQASRGPQKGKAFQRALAIFHAIQEWNRLYPAESFALSPGILETVFRVHRQAAKDFFDTLQNELWEYHQEIGVESPRWHNRGKDTEKLKHFVEEKLNR